jgi:hypothetical protein
MSHNTRPLENEGQPPESRAALVYNPYAASPEPSPRLPVTPASVVEHRASRIAGGFMVISAALTLMEGLNTREPSVAGLFIDVWIGIALLRGKETYRILALIRVILGALYYGGTAIIQEEILTAAFVVLCSAGFLLLLVTRPGSARIVLGVLFCSLFVILQFVVLLS